MARCHVWNLHQANHTPERTKTLRSKTLHTKVLLPLILMGGGGVCVGLAMRVGGRRVDEFGAVAENVVAVLGVFLQVGGWLGLSCGV